MRKLATVRKIDSVRPIPGADAIEVARVGGWDVVVKKDEFRAGDIAIYFEIDSWVPHHLAPFLSKGKEPREYNGVKGERLRTVTLRNQVSQGLLLQTGQVVHILMHEEWAKKNGKSPKWEDNIGEDLTEVLGVQKWEAAIPAELSGQVKGVFPSFIPKTDQERCQNLIHEIFTENAESKYEVSIKLDGTSFTGYYFAGMTGVCSRNWELKVDDSNASNSLVRMFIDSNLQSALTKIGKNYAVQGELMGPGIQANREKLSKTKLFIFDVFDIENNRYLDPDSRHRFMEDLSREGIDHSMVEHVPIVSFGVTLDDLGITDVSQLLSHAEGSSINHAVREGLVFKRVDGKFSFKAISNLFLLKNKE